MKALFIVILLSLFSCGDSPLLSDDEPSGKPSIEALVGKDVIRAKGYTLTLKYDGNPELYVNNSAIVMVQNRSGDFVNISEGFLFDLWMPDHGHGSGVIDLENVSKGIYKLSRISFIMPGDWILRFNTEIDGNFKEQSSWPISF